MPFFIARLSRDDFSRRRDVLAASESEATTPLFGAETQHFPVIEHLIPAFTL